MLDLSSTFIRNTNRNYPQLILHRIVIIQEKIQSKYSNSRSLKKGKKNDVSLFLGNHKSMDCLLTLTVLILFEHHHFIGKLPQYSARKQGKLYALSEQIRKSNVQTLSNQRDKIKNIKTFSPNASFHCFCCVQTRFFFDSFFSYFSSIEK